MVGPKVKHRAKPNTSKNINSMIILIKDDAIASDTAAVGAQSGQSDCFSKFAPCQQPDPIVPHTSLAAVSTDADCARLKRVRLRSSSGPGSTLNSLFRVLAYFSQKTLMDTEDVHRIIGDTSMYGVLCGTWCSTLVSCCSSMDNLFGLACYCGALGLFVHRVLKPHCHPCERMTCVP